MSKIKVKPEVISDTEKNGENDDGKESPEGIPGISDTEKNGENDDGKESKDDATVNGGETINIFSILQDAYMYRGYNRFLFFVFYMITLLLVLKALSYNNDDAYMKRRVTKAFLPDEDIVDSPSAYPLWILDKFENCYTNELINNAPCIHQRLQLISLSIVVIPSGCKGKHGWPKEYDSTFVNKADTDSIAKSYEHAYCESKYEDTEPDVFRKMLMDQYNVYSYEHAYYGTVLPFYTAEMNLESGLNFTKTQLQNIRKMLQSETKNVFVNHHFVEFLDPVTHLFFFSDCGFWTSHIHFPTLWVGTMNLAPIPKNTWLTMWLIIFIFYHSWLAAGEVTDIYETHHLKKRLRVLDCNIKYKLDIEENKTTEEEYIKQQRKKKTCVKVCCLTPSKACYSHVSENPFNLLDVFILVMTFIVFLQGFLYSAYLVPIPYDIPGNPKGSIDDIKEISGILYKSIPSYYSFTNGAFVNHWDHIDYLRQYIGMVFMVGVIILVKELSWHRGVSILYFTINRVYNELLDTFTISIIMLIGVAGWIYGTFGKYIYLSSNRFNSVFN